MIFFWLLFSNFSPQTWCENVKILQTGGISCDLKKKIVKTHNEIRERIANGLIKNQPPAANMREMYWDEELADKAQKWASKCTFAHSNDTVQKTKKFQKLGQNIAISRNHSRYNAFLEKAFLTQIHKWLQEGMNYRFIPLSSELVKKIGHYTQLAWANTHLVGCGYSQFQINDIIYHLYVCNYAISGNSIGDLPYIPGSQKCPEEFNHSENYFGLCSTQNMLELICKSGKQTSDNSLKITTLLTQKPKSLWDGRKSMIKKNRMNELTVDDFKLDRIKPDVNRLRDGVAITNLQVDKMYNILYF